MIYWTFELRSTPTVRFAHTHTWAEEDSGGGRVLCGRVHKDHLLEGTQYDRHYPSILTARPTCPECFSRDPRFHKIKVENIYPQRCFNLACPNKMGEGTFKDFRLTEFISRRDLHVVGCAPCIMGLLEHLGLEERS